MAFWLKTINHRKLVQELYDKRVLHNLLGLKPSPTVVNGDDSGVTLGIPTSSASQAVRSTQSAWHQAEVGVRSDDEHRPSRRRHVSEDEDEGRYDINRRQPPQKRRKMGRPQDSHTIFTTDDEHDSIRDSLDEEEAHYEVDLKDVGMAEKRRSFWLSKAIDMGGTIDDDNDS